MENKVKRKELPHISSSQQILLSNQMVGFIGQPGILRKS